MADAVMPEPQPLTLPPEHQAADLPGLLEPYLWLDEITPVFQGYRRLLYVRLRGIVRAPEGFPSDEGITRQAAVYALAHKARKHYAAVAELAIAVVEGAGYLHSSHPVIELAGEVRNRRRDGKPDLLVARCELRMELTRSEW